MEPLEPPVSFVIPVFNEAPYLEKTVAGIIRSAGMDCEIVIVDDGSTDDSYRVMQKLADEYPCVRALRLDGNYGQQNATLAGLLRAGGTWACTMDADLQHPPEAFPALMAEAADGAEVVYGVPTRSLTRPLRRLGSMLRDTVFLLFLGKPAGVRLSSFRIIRKDILERLTVPETSVVYVSAELLKLTRNIASVPVVMAPSPHKKSGYGFGSLVRIMYDLVTTYGNIPGLRGMKKTGTPFRIAEVYPCD